MKIGVQNLLKNTDLICFVIPSLFSKAECEALLNSNVKNSFQKAIANYPTYYRNNERFVIDSEELAHNLFKKVKPYLPKRIEVISNIETENGIWNLYELNNRLRFCKYSANQYFNRHLDGIHYRSKEIQSKLTFMIYLNSATEFEGGKTLFYKSKNTSEIWASYTPKQGDLIVFDHNIWHEGEMLLQGEKFVLRSDILYKRQENAISVQSFSGHLGYVWKLLKFDNSHIISGGRDKVTKVWNVNGTVSQNLLGHENSILSIEKMNENTFITGSRDQRIIVWQKNSNEQFEKTQILHIHSALILSLCRLTNTKFASSSGDNTIKICGLDGQVFKIFIEHKNWVWQVIRLSDTIIASCSEDKTIKIWDIESERPIKTFYEKSPVFCLEYIGNQLISGNLKGEIIIKTLTEDYQLLRNQVFQAHHGIIRTIKVINNTHFATGGEDNKVKIWNIRNQECILELVHQNFVQSLELVNDNLLSASFDGTIKVWE